MKTKNLFYALSIAVAAVAMTACSSENDVTTAPDIDNPGETSTEASGTWHVTINAGPAETRAISIGGNSGNALFTNWNTSDVVEVVKDGAVIGTLTATESTGNSAYAVLEGTLTGTFAVDDVLTLYYHSATFNYTGQNGTLAGVSTSKSYLTATSTVTAINVASSDINSSGSSGKLTMSDASFTAQQAYMDITFTDDLGNPYDITKLQVYTSGGKLVTTMGIASGATSYATEGYPLTITPTSATNHFFIALRDENGSSNTYYFKATTAYGVLTYSQSLNLVNGKYYKSGEPKVLYVAPSITVSTGNKYEHTGYCRIGTNADDSEDTPTTASVSGTSKGYYIDLANPATVTLTGIDATLKDHEFLTGLNGSAAYVYNIDGANRIYTKGDYAIYADYNTSSTVKFKGNGTLTVTSSNHNYCGIIANNYKTDSNSWNTTDKEVDVSTQLAVSGSTVKRSARIDNADGTYTWKYTVSTP